MKNNILYCLLIFALNSCQKYPSSLILTSCGENYEIDTNYSKAEALQQKMEELVSKNVPGCAIAVFSDEGWWADARGFAKLEDQTAMQTCHLQYLQSISKTYMAVAILKLQEEGRIELDHPITDYLSETYSQYISDAERITVRMLLNHTSGVPEYNFVSSYVTYLLQHPDHVFTGEDYLEYIEGKDLDFKPGSTFSYRNTNYVLLALIADAITGNHAHYIQKHIFETLNLHQTFYRNDSNYLDYSTLVNTYFDRHGDGILENISFLQRNNVAALLGDDGIVTTPIDAIQFLKGLLEKDLLTSNSLQQMQDWVKNEEGKPLYGLGLNYETLGGHPAYGHSGGGIGAGSQLYYFPDQDLYVFMAINLGIITESPIHVEAGKIIEELYEIILE